MKKFILLLMVCVLAVSSFAGVYAEPEADEPVAIEEQAEEMPIDLAEDASLPIEEEQDTIEAKVYLKIKNNGSATYTIKTYADDDTYEYIASQIDMLNAQAAESGDTYAVGQEGSKKYIEVTSHKAPGDSIAVSGASSQNGRFAINKGLFGTEYFATGDFDSRQSTLETPVEESTVYALVTVELPFPATYSNADLKENFGTKLTWNVYLGRINPVEIKFTAPNYIALAILLLIIVLAIVLIIVYKNKKNAITDAELFQDALHHLEGETSDEYVEDPFFEMTDEEIEADIQDEFDSVDEEIQEFVEEVLDEIEEPAEEVSDEIEQETTEE